MALAYLLATAVLSVFLLPFILPAFGQLIRRKSQSQRKHLLSKATTSANQNVWRAKSGANDEDGWENVDVAFGDIKIGGNSQNEDWAGIVGFFHPFWYALRTGRVENRSADSCTVMQEGAVSVSFGLPYEQLSYGGLKQSAQFTQVIMK